MKNAKLLIGSLLLISLFSCSGNVGVETYFNISFYDYDGINLLATEKYLENTEIVYNGETPTRASSNGYNYFFSGWSDEVGGEVKTHIADKNKFLYAVYNEVPVTSIIVEKPAQDKTEFSYTGEILSYTIADSEYYKVYGCFQTNAGEYTVTIRLKDKENTCWNDGTTDDLEYPFVINKAENAWDVIPTISNWDYGKEKPIPSGKAKFGEISYSFSRDEEIFVDELEYLKGTWYLKASIEETINYKGLNYIVSFYVDTNCYTIIFYDENGDIIKEIEVEKNSTIETDFDNPTKKENQQYTYDFIGWSEVEDGSVSSSLIADKDKSYYPVFKETLKKYDIKFVYASGEEIDTISFDYGTIPTCEVNSQSNNIASKEFLYWTDGVNQYEVLPEVTKNQTYTAIFSNELKDGFGDENNPYIIANIDDLFSLNELIKNGLDTSGKYFVLSSDLDLTKTEIDQIDNLNNSFKGSFNGNNHTIKFNSRDGDNLGLFACNDGIIKNLVVSADIKGNNNIGVVCATNNGSIVNCKTSGIIEGNTSLGGVVGYNNGKVINCVSDVQFKDIVVMNNISSNGIGKYVGKTGEQHQISYAENVWDGSIATSFALGSGTSEDPYIIATASELAYLKESTNSENSYYANTYFELSNSIDLNNVNWTGIGGGYSSSAFAGVFNGKNNRIYNVNISTSIDRTGFFNSASGELKNISLEGKLIGTGSSNTYLGLLVGINTAEINNCVINGYVKAEGSYVSGIMGWNGGGNITNTSYIGSVEGITVVGGIAGYNYRNNGVIGNLSNCKNYSTVIASDRFELNNNTGVGGIVGLNGSDATIDECINYGLVKTENASGGTGGIIGHNYQSNITNSHNEGNVISLDVAAGIVGRARQYEVLYSNCTNSGNISGFSQIGGIAGYAGSNVDTTITISNCINKESATITASHSAGGIVGYNYADITKCTNEGKITFNDAEYGYWIGGIVGMNGTKAYISSCVNKGEVYGVGSALGGVGGIAGSNYGSDITSCENFGTIVASYRVGGIVGYTQNSASKIDNCTNKGTIISNVEKGPLNLGGIVGYNTGYITNCKNYGSYQVKEDADISMYDYIVGQDTMGSTGVYDNVNYVE